MWERFKMLWYRLFHPQPNLSDTYIDPNIFDDDLNPLIIDATVTAAEIAVVGLDDLIDTAANNQTNADFGFEDSSDFGGDFGGDSSSDFGGDSS